MPTPAATTGTAHTRGTHTPKPGDPRLSLAPPTCQAQQVCINPACASTYPVGDTLVSCRACGSLLDVRYRWPWSFPRNWSFLRPMHGAYGHPDASGVWRFRSLLPFFNHPDQIASIGEGRTILQQADLLAEHLGFSPGTLHLQYEGQNPSGSFKDNGMTAAFTHARMVGARVCACASTGNTSAAMAVYAAQSGIKAVIFIGDGKIAYGKLSHALDYGALTLQVAGDFDTCLARVRSIAENIPQAGVYLMNSVNPFRLEGQKTVMYRVLEGLNFRVPDWVVVPGGNLGNCSAFGKAFMELKALGLIDKLPRLAVINASGAATLDRLYNHHAVRWNHGDYFTRPDGKPVVDAEYARMDAANERASTIASAIEINRPVNLPKALRALEVMDGSTRQAGTWTGGQPGLVRSVPDETIKHYKALVGRFGFGCEPASAASLAGAHMLLQEGHIT
ncbi:MAG: threonine synthase, partial [bacterium]